MEGGAPTMGLVLLPQEETGEPRRGLSPASQPPAPWSQPTARRAEKDGGLWSPSAPAPRSVQQPELTNAQVGTQRHGAAQKAKGGGGLQALEEGLTHRRQGLRKTQAAQGSGLALLASRAGGLWPRRSRTGGKEARVSRPGREASGDQRGQACSGFMGTST